MLLLTEHLQPHSEETHLFKCPAWGFSQKGLEENVDGRPLSWRTSCSSQGKKKKARLISEERSHPKGVYLLWTSRTGAKFINIQQLRRNTRLQHLFIIMTLWSPSHQIPSIKAEALKKKQWKEKLHQSADPGLFPSWKQTSKNLPPQI